MHITEEVLSSHWVSLSVQQTSIFIGTFPTWPSKSEENNLKEAAFSLSLEGKHYQWGTLAVRYVVIRLWLEGYPETIHTHKVRKRYHSWREHTAPENRVFLKKLNANGAGEGYYLFLTMRWWSPRWIDDFWMLRRVNTRKEWWRDDVRTARRKVRSCWQQSSYCAQFAILIWNMKTWMLF